MNIGEHFYCSRCLRELYSESGDEVKCSKCGYDPFDFDSNIDEHALKECTMLNDMRFQIGAVRRRTKSGYIYGAFDYVKQRPVYIFEYFPDINKDTGTGLEREKIFGCKIIIPDDYKDEFEREKKFLVNTLNNRHKTFEENNTLYIFRK